MRALIFDFNGTLIFDDPYHYEAWENIVAKIRPDLDPKVFISGLDGQNNKELLLALNPEFKEADFQKYSALKEGLYRDLFSKSVDFHLVTGAVELLDYLKYHDYLFTIASNSVKANIDFFVTGFELDKWLDKEAIIYDDGSYLNKGEMFVSFKEKHDLAYDDIIVFEDSPANIKKAKELGCITVGVGDSKKRDKLRKAGADYLIKDFSEFDYKILE